MGLIYSRITTIIIYNFRTFPQSQKRNLVPFRYYPPISPFTSVPSNLWSTLCLYRFAHSEYVIWRASFTFIKMLFSSSSLSAIRVVSSVYPRLLIFLPVMDKWKVLYPCGRILLSHKEERDTETCYSTDES